MVLLVSLSPRPCSCWIFSLLLPFSVVATADVSAVLLVVEGDSVAVVVPATVLGVFGLRAGAQSLHNDDGRPC